MASSAEDWSDGDWPDDWSGDDWPDDPPPAVAVDKRSPRRKTAAGMLALPMLLVMSLLLSIPLLAVEDPGLTWPLLVLDSASVLVVLWALWFTGQPKDWRNALLFRRPPVRWLLVAVGLGLAMQFFFALLTWWLESLGLASSESEIFGDVDAAVGVDQAFVLYISIPLIAPLVEEVFYRGYVFGFLSSGSWSQKRKGVGLVTAIVLSSLFFAASHFQSTGADGSTTSGDWYLMGCIFLVGVVNALLVWRTRSIFVPMAAHATFNLVPAVVVGLL